MTTGLSEKHPRIYRLVWEVMAIVLLILFTGIAISGVAAQNSATVSVENVSIENAGDTAMSSVHINADEGVSAADTKVSIANTSIANITGAQEGDSVSGSNLDISVAPDGSYVWLNYSDIAAQQTDFTVAEVEIEAQKGEIDSTGVSLETNNYFNASFSSFDTIYTDGATVNVGSITPTATVSVDDLTIKNAGANETSNVDIQANKNVSVADTKVTVGNTSVAKITDVGSVASGVTTDVASDGSYVWLNYTDLSSQRTDFTLAQVEVEAQTGESESTNIGLETKDYSYVNSTGSLNTFDSVTIKNGTVTVGATVATVSAENVSVPLLGDTETSKIHLQADEGVSTADTKITVRDPTVANILTAKEGDTTTSSSLDVNVAGDGSYAWLNYTDTGGGQKNFTVAEVEFEAQTGDVDSTKIGLETNNYAYLDNGNPTLFEPVYTVNATASTGTRPATFLITDLSPRDAAVLNGGSLNVTAGVENVGDKNGTQNVNVSVDNEVLGNESVSLDSGENTTLNLSINTTGLGYGEFEYSVTSDNDTATGNLRVVENLVPANVTTHGAEIGLGEKQNVTVKVDAPNGLATADVKISVDTSVARISDVRRGNDTKGPAKAFDVPNRTDGSVYMKYSDLESKVMNDSELAVLEYEHTSVGPDVPVRVETENFKYFDGDVIPYASVNATAGNITGAAFLQPLIDRSSFVGPPTNTDELDPMLYEDLSGDGDGTDIAQTVAVFGEMVRGTDFGLTHEQARLLNWNDGSSDTEFTPSDLVTLFGKQIRAK